MENTSYPVIQFGSFRYSASQRTTPRNSPRSPAQSPRRQNSPRSPVKYNNVQEQLDFANVKYQEVLRKYMSTPCSSITSKQEEDVWAWGIFSEVVLPMLTIIDDE